jgi:hypothetical protein
MDPTSPTRTPDSNLDANPWAAGLSVFAAVMLMSVGALQFLQGLAAIINDEQFVIARGYAFKIDVSAWGWIHMLLGIIVAVVGYFILTGAPWARGAGIAIAALSLLANFLFIPYYPLWSLVLIALDVAVMWALAVYSPLRR